ncbi:Uncharacterised protein [Collinsella intestinalis]|nr:Uncharacterised protein [Collinsella intestinalis]
MRRMHKGNHEARHRPRRAPHAHDVFEHLDRHRSDHHLRGGVPAHRVPVQRPDFPFGWCDLGFHGLPDRELPRAARSAARRWRTHRPARRHRGLCPALCPGDPYGHRSADRPFTRRPRQARRPEFLGHAHGEQIRHRRAPERCGEYRVAVRLRAGHDQSGALGPALRGPRRYRAHGE